MNRSDCLFALVFAALPAPAFAGWNVEVVDGPPQFEQSALRFAPNGDLAVAYAGDALYLARWDGAAWRTKIVEPGGCFFANVSLAFDAASLPALAYIDSDLGNLHYARWDGSRWEVETIDAPGTAGAYASLAIDPVSGDAAVAYYDENLGDLKFARRGPSGWAVETVESTGDVGAYASLAVDEAGIPWIAYQDLALRELRSARREGTGWRIDTIDPIDPDAYPGFRGVHLSIALDGAGRPAVAYFDPDLDVALKLARWDGAAWSASVIEESFEGPGTSVAFDPSGQPLVSYHHDGTDSLKLARWDGLAWLIETVDTDAGGEYSSLALSPSGNPAISYYASIWAPIERMLKVARWSGGSWQIETIDRRGYASDPSLAVDPAGRPVMGIDGHPRPAELEYARWNGSAWERESVDPAGGNGSLALDASGNPMISYFDSSSSDLRLARHDGTAWRTELVDGEDAGWDSALALDPGGRPAISYSATPDGELRCARWDGLAWQIDTIDLMHEYSSIAVDAAGNPAISYYHLVPRDPAREIRFARWDGSTWRIESVAPVEGATGHNSLALDPAGNPRIAFADSAIPGVALASWDGSGWSTEIVDSSVLASFVSLALRSGVDPVIAYGHYLHRNLKVAVRDGAGWRIETVGDPTSGAPVELRPSLALDLDGNPLVAYYDDCMEGVKLARYLPPGNLHRGVVGSLAAGWRASALPLLSTNDDETPPFPTLADPPGLAADPLPATESLLLYRFLGPGDAPSGNRLRAVKAAGVQIRF